ncbi:carbohydrate-binding protein [Reichenbachiella versicolor]|uniref:carbohydrate-binding protein n=1 Tax=Reichenbachiella versicolor TaxID=1821036 RepID=UPI000D6E991B|nr:carbohydrate-binding protein [Reichenbachiella versicolor]
MSILISNLSSWAAISVNGEKKKWHKVTLDIVGVQASETGIPNPFLDYKLTGVFTQGNISYEVPGYFAADGNAAETGATQGDVWRIHFTPPTTGQWNYKIRFRSGTDVAIKSNIAAGSAVNGQDNVTGSFIVTDTDKTGLDLRGKGRLKYVDEHHLQFSENGEWFLKAGSDAPENFLAYDDFDNTSNNGGRRKSWSLHTGDWNSGDPEWKASKGHGIIGAINYLSSKGMNVFSFLTMNIQGDDGNVYPYVSKNNFLQFDCSKLDQWEIVFNHGQRKGMYLHFKTQETENETLLDGGAVGRERKVYYRELIARFGHHLALNWNLGEENGDFPKNGDQNDQQRIQMAQYFRDTDPYDNHIVLHTAPSSYNKIYTPLLGSNSEITGVSIQTHWNHVHNVTKDWVKKSADAGKAWVVANDEQGGANTGVPPDSHTGTPNKHDIRKQTLWGNLMAGGAGVEYYFGYSLPCDDLDCENFRTRNDSWEYAAHALRFFNLYIPFWEMKCDDGIVSANNAYGFYKEGDVYVVYLRNGGSTTVDLASGSYTVKWYNPRTGGNLVDGSTTNISGGNNTSIGSAPNGNDWVALIRNVNFLHSGNGGPKVDVTGVTLTPSSVQIEEYMTSQLSASILPSNASIQSVTWSSSNTSVATVNTQGVVTGVSAGMATISVTTSDGGFSASSVVTVTAATGVTVDLNSIEDAYLQNGTRYNTGDLRVENGRRVSYLKFDLSGLTGEVTIAELKLSVSNDAGNGTIIVGKGDSNNWTETNLSSSNAPNGITQLGALNTSYGIGNTYSWVLDQSAIQTGGVLTLVVSQISGGDVSFASDENSNSFLKPVLTIRTSIASSNNPTQTPYLGSASSIPGVIESENFDLGGEGVAYHDNGQTNQGGAYRVSEGVDLEQRDGGISVGWTQSGEWLEYTVDATAGIYDLKARVASQSAGNDIDILLDGNKIATVNVPNTGDWGNFQTVTIKGVTIPAGSHEIRLEFVTGAVNLNWISFQEEVGGNGSPVFVENDGYLVIEAESVNLTGKIWSFQNSRGNNPLGTGFIQYDGGWRGNPNTLNENEKLTYAVKINTPGTYQFIWRTGYGFSSTTFDSSNDSWLKINGSEFYGKSGSTKVDCTGEYMKVWVQKDAFVNECFGEHHGTNGMSIWADFDTPGYYSIEVAGRSPDHIIDRLFLFQTSKRTTALNNNTPESPTESSSSSRLIDSDVFESSQSTIQVFPNSFKNDLNISLSSSHAFKEVQLLDVNGAILETTDIVDKSKISIHTSVNAGVYFLRFTGSNQVKVVRVIKQ